MWAYDTVTPDHSVGRIEVGLSTRCRRCCIWLMGRDEFESKSESKSCSQFHNFASLAVSKRLHCLIKYAYFWITTAVQCSFHWSETWLPVKLISVSGFDVDRLAFRFCQTLTSVPQWAIIRYGCTLNRNKIETQLHSLQDLPFCKARTKGIWIVWEENYVYTLE